MSFTPQKGYLLVNLKIFLYWSIIENVLNIKKWENIIYGGNKVGLQVSIKMQK